MKKLLSLLVFMFAAYSTLMAQSLDKGTWLFEAGTNTIVGDLSKKGASTGLALYSSDGVTYWSIGSEAGYFVAKNTAVKIGLGYTDLDGDGYFAYKGGIKYYVNGMIPFEVDITGATTPDFVGPFGGTFETPDPLWLGIQGGYAAFLNDNVAIEPAIRYNVSLNSDFSQEGLFELRVGFVVFL